MGPSVRTRSNNRCTTGNDRINPRIRNASITLGEYNVSHTKAKHQDGIR